LAIYVFLCASICGGFAIYYFEQYVEWVLFIKSPQVFCIFGWRSPLLFVVELGTANSVASATVPVFSNRSLRRSRSSGQALIGQLVLLQQVPKASDRRLVRQPPVQRQAGELAGQQHVMQRLFHRRFTQRELMLNEADAQHGEPIKRRATGLALQRVGDTRATNSDHGTTCFI
jgi:hypothetical protein